MQILNKIILFRQAILFEFSDFHSFTDTLNRLVSLMFGDDILAVLKKITSKLFLKIYNKQKYFRSQRDETYIYNVVFTFILHSNLKCFCGNCN